MFSGKMKAVTYSFDRQDNLYRFNPSAYHIMESDKLFELGEKFVNLTPDKAQIYYNGGIAMSLI